MHYTRQRSAYMRKRGGGVCKQLRRWSGNSPGCHVPRLRTVARAVDATSCSSNHRNRGHDHLRAFPHRIGPPSHFTQSRHHPSAPGSLLHHPSSIFIASDSPRCLVGAPSSTAPAHSPTNTCTAALSDIDPEDSSAGEEEIPAPKDKSAMVKAEQEEEEDDEESEPDECAHCSRS
jgi:hypothetical protein